MVEFGSSWNILPCTKVQKIVKVEVFEGYLEPGNQYWIQKPYQTAQNISTRTLEQLSEAKNYWKPGFRKYCRSEKWLISNPELIFTIFFINFNPPQGVSAKNTSPEIKKICENLIGKYFWARKKPFSWLISNPEPVFTIFFKVFVLSQGVSPENTPPRTEKMLKNMVKSGSGLEKSHFQAYLEPRACFQWIFLSVCASPRCIFQKYTSWNRENAEKYSEK